MNLQKRIEIFKRLQAANPHPTTELVYHTPYELLIAVILSAQATDVSVNKATDGLFKVANTPAQMLALGEAGLKRFIKIIGLYNSKAANIIKTSEILVNQYDSKVPDNAHDLEKLPGVGHKTANVILNTIFGQPTIAVDTHIFRVANRMRLAPGKNVREVEKNLMEAVPDQFKHDAHHWLILHGRYMCVARKPRCGSCLINDLCEFPDKTVMP